MSFASVMSGYAWAGWWRMSTLNDSSGNGRTLTKFGPVPGNAAGLIVNDADTACSMTANGFWYTDSTTWLNLPSFSVFVRIKPSTVSGQHGLVCRGDASGHGSWRLSQVGTDVALLNPAGASVAAGVTMASGGSYTIGATYDSTTSTARVYVDGVLRATSTSVPITNTTGRLALGGEASTTDNNRYSGVLDEAAVIGVVLTDADMQALHTAATADVAATGGAGSTATATATLSIVGTSTANGRSTASAAAAQDISAAAQGSGRASATAAGLAGDDIVTAASTATGASAASATATRDATGTADASGASAATADGTLAAKLATTDLHNRTNGRTRTGSGENHTEHPIAATTVNGEPIRIMAQQLPAPTLKNGRPQ